jgi:fimbrial chaperone protein
VTPLKTSTLLKVLLHSTPVVIAGLASWTYLAPATAQFTATISPPRFELEVKAKQVDRRTIDITNAGSQNARYRVYTADWTLDEAGELKFSTELQPDSCRPWVALERAKFQLPAGGKLRYRFEVQAPDTLPAQECRFAIFFEGDDEHFDANLPIPMNGRMGVVVYVRHEGLTIAAKTLEPVTLRAEGLTVPGLGVTNTGGSTIRFSGFLEGRDANGKRVYFSPSSLPVLPGQTRTVAMMPVDPMQSGKAAKDRTPVTWVWPLDVSGDLIISDTGKQSVPVKFTLAGK